MKLLVTGGAGFIGSAFVRHALASGDSTEVFTLDKLTYAGNLQNLAAVSGNERHHFTHGDICDARLVTSILIDHAVDAIVHFAAESHVDRSILSPLGAVEANVIGTATVLEAARVAKVERVLAVSTDEVYGSLEPPLAADEAFPLNPSSPYSASKAAADLLALSYVRTFRLPVIVTRASNNYGPYQFPEKLIPLMILNALEGSPLPMYGDGLQVRDWLHVEDHCRALMAVLHRGRVGEIYNVGGTCALTNREVIEQVLRIVGAPDTLVRAVADRPGHDRRYAVNSEKIARHVGFEPTVQFQDGLEATVQWYRENTGWTQGVRSGAYRDYYHSNYGRRAGIEAAGDAVEQPACESQ